MSVPIGSVMWMFWFGLGCPTVISGIMFGMRSALYGRIERNEKKKHVAKSE
jgi:hypothetical protein